MGSDHLISFAVEKEWYDPAAGRPFNIPEVYELDWNTEQAGHQRRESSVVEAEKSLLDKAPKISIRNVFEILRDRKFLNRGTKYGQVAQLRSNVPKELAVLWIAIGPPEASVFIPYYLGITSVPVASTLDDR